MALAPTLYQFDVSLSHVDRAVQQELEIRIARHPSESLDRVWLRVLAYCLHWQEGIAFGPGLSDPEAPDLLARDLTGEEVLWVRVGRPDPQKLEREVDRHPSARLAALFDSPDRMEAFLAEARAKRLSRLGRIEIAAIDPKLLAWLCRSDQRRNRLALTIVGDHLYADQNGEVADGPLARAGSLVPDTG